MLTPASSTTGEASSLVEPITQRSAIIGVNGITGTGGTTITRGSFSSAGAGGIGIQAIGTLHGVMIRTTPIIRTMARSMATGI